MNPETPNVNIKLLFYFATVLFAKFWKKYTLILKNLIKIFNLINFFWFWKNKLVFNHFKYINWDVFFNRVLFQNR